MNTYNDFLILLCDELEMEISEIQENMAFRELRHWSSLNALLLISKIHEQTGKLISPAQLATITTVKELYSLTQ